MDSTPPIDAVLAALADPTRRHIVEMLADGGPMTVSAIASRFEMSRQAVGKHLGVLRDASLVSSERQGRERRNRLRREALDPLAEWSRRYAAFWDDRLAALKRMVEGKDTR